MPIVIASCPDCGHVLEIDTFRAVVLTGTAETLWRQIRQQYRAGQQVNVQVVSDQTFLSRSHVYDLLKRLAVMGLIQRRKVRRYHHYYVAPPLHLMAKLSTRAA
jgi:hypothetical protein